MVIFTLEKSVLLLLIIISISFAEHPSVQIDEKGKIIDQHLKLHVEKHQQYNLSKNRFIVLTNDQKDTLNENGFSPIDTLFVINNRYHDCTCNDLVGIWMESKIIIPLDYKNIWNRKVEFFSKTPKAQYFEETLEYGLKNQFLIMGINQEITYQGELLSQGGLKKILSDKSNRRYVLVTPPRYSKKRTNTFKRKMKKLYDIDVIVW